jgi:ABC transporter
VLYNKIQYNKIKSVRTRPTSAAFAEKLFPERGWAAGLAGGDVGLHREFIQTNTLSPSLTDHAETAQPRLHNPIHDPRPRRSAAMLRYPVLLSRTGTISTSYRTVRRHAASTTASPPPLISIKKGSFFRSYPSSTGVDPANRPLLTEVYFTLDSIRAERGRSENEKPRPSHWAVIGPGSSTFLNILRGQHIAVPPKSRSYPYLSSDEFSPKNAKLRHPSNAIQYVGFSGEGSQATGGTRGAYLSARYESLREETDWTVLQYLKGQTELNPLEGQGSSRLYDEDLFQEVVQNLRLRDLLDMPVSNLSNGQTRRTRIAKALLAQPELLLLDEPFSEFLVTASTTNVLTSDK